ncbi:MAG: hypothetical protein GY926_12530 [bacterium]|nr:hypothetical protein [bacterium]
MADNDPGARSLPSRRRALQIGAGAAFSVPTITSLAASPAYAACVSGGGDLVIDTFGLDQVTGTIEPTDGTFVHDTREIRGSAYIDADEMFFPGVGGDADVLDYEGLTITPSFSLVGCQEVVLTNCSVINVINPITLRVGQPGTLIFSTLGAPDELIFDLGGVSAADLANPFPFALSGGFPAPEVRSFGPLIAR